MPKANLGLVEDGLEALPACLRPGPPITVGEPPKLDLDSYISNYEGLTRLDRLMVIGGTSKILAFDSLKLAWEEARKGRNIDKYVSTCNLISLKLPPAQAARILVSDSWVENRKKSNKAESDRLESELKGYKNNLIKESIRMGNEEVGMHFYQTGELTSAWHFLNRMREYCTTPKHVAEMCLKLMLVAVAQESWLHVQSCVHKIQALQLKSEERTKIEPILAPCLGLASLANSNYATAAQHFLASDPAFIALDSVGGLQFNKQILTGNDLAIYGGLCALASLDRMQLQQRVLDNSAFRNFLELEPQIRRAIGFFIASKYTQALSILEAYRPDYLLDIHLQRHIDELYSRIRRKSIVAFFEPFSRVSISAMADIFNAKSVQEIEDELIGMIERKEIEARIDAVSGVLESVERDARRQIMTQTLALAHDADKGLRLKLVGVNMLHHALEVKSDPDRKKKRWAVGR